jgi:hypothetical protein
MSNKRIVRMPAEVIFIFHVPIASNVYPYIFLPLTLE